MIVNASNFLIRLNALEQFPSEKASFYNLVRSNPPLKALFDNALNHTSWVLQHQGSVVEAINAIYPHNEASEKVMALSCQIHQISLNSFVQMFSSSPIDITGEICDAISNGNFLQVAYLLGQKQNLININVERIKFLLQDHFSFKHNISKLFYQTLENTPYKEELKGLFFDIHPEDGSTPLLWALRRGFFELAEVLVRSCGENKNLKKILFQQPQKSDIPYNILGVITGINYSLLNQISPGYKVEFDFIDCLLASCGGDRDLKELLFQPYNGANPLHLAVKQNNLEMSRSLLASCGKDRGLKELLFQPNNIINKERKNPLFIAIENNNLAMVEILLEFCGDDRGLQQLLFSPNDANYTPLMCAVMQNNIGISRFLLASCRGDQNLKNLLLRPDSFGNTPLQYAGQRQNWLMVQALHYLI